MPCPSPGAAGMAESVSSLPLFRPWAGLSLIPALPLAAVIATRPLLPGSHVHVAMLDSLLRWPALMPRAATAILAGAALGLSGALLQRVLRNPIADPSTLGIASGAQLALTLGIAFAPALIAAWREGVALAGGLAAAGGVLALDW